MGYTRPSRPSTGLFPFDFFIFLAPLDEPLDALAASEEVSMSTDMYYLEDEDKEFREAKMYDIDVDRMGNASRALEAHL